MEVTGKGSGPGLEKCNTYATRSPAIIMWEMNVIHVIKTAVMDTFLEMLFGWKCKIGHNASNS